MVELPRPEAAEEKHSIDEQGAGEAAAAVVDCRGRLCPMPVVMLGRAMGALEPGQIVRVLATDRCAATDIPAWAADTGNDLLRWHDDGPHLVFDIRKGLGED